MAESLYSDDVSSLAHRVAEQIAALCPHVPTGEVNDVSSRLAFAELAHAAGVAFESAGPEPAIPLGNRVVWLPGSSTSAIVLPAGEEQKRAVAVMAQLLAWTRGRGAHVGEVAARGTAALRQLGSALVTAYQTRSGAQ